MSTRLTRAPAVVEEVPATRRYSDGAAAYTSFRYTAVPFPPHEQQAQGDEGIDEALTSDKDTYSQHCENFEGSDLENSIPRISFDEFLSSESDTTCTQDSDTDSFYSVQSHRTLCGGDSFLSLQPSDSNSESTLYESAQSLQAISPSPATPFHIPLSKEKCGFREHNNILNVPSTQVYRSDAYECTSCPDLSPLEEYGCATVSPHLSPGLTRGIASMSTLDRTGSPKTPRSPKVGEDGDKKKKGLMSSFRKSRKTGRKLRQQKMTVDADTGSASIGVNSDGEVFDSESSAPNSPAVIKNQTVGILGDGEDTDDPMEVPDSHERFNGSPPSPVNGTGTKVEDGVKKAEEKDDKKKERSKFGSFLRKEKKKVDSTSKSSLVSTTSAASSQGTEPYQISADRVSTNDSSELKQETKEIKNNTDQMTEGEDSNSKTEDDIHTPAVKAPQAEKQSLSSEPTDNTSSSSVQFVRNFIVSSSVPKDKKPVDNKPKPNTKPPIKVEKNVESAEMKKNVKPASTETNSSIEKREHLYKILVIGELGTGKTSIIKRYVHQFFSQHYRATIGVDFALKVLNWDNNTVIRLQLWDIAGQERFGNMTRVYYKEAVGAFVVFDVTRSQTFDAVTKWKNDLDTKVTLADGSPIPTVLLANKCDQPKEGVVNNPARMDDYCRERGFSGWFETSAKENINIDEASRFLVNRILTNEKQGMMMTESLDADKFSVDGKTQQAGKRGCLC